MLRHDGRDRPVESRREIERPETQSRWFVTDVNAMRREARRRQSLVRRQETCDGASRRVIVFAQHKAFAFR